MLTLVQFGLLCGVVYAGAHTLIKQRSKPKALWLVPANGLPKSSLLPLLSRVYIIRCWKERTSQQSQGVMRYVLEIPATGQRCGYMSAEGLLETLARELTQAQETDADMHKLIA
jgi:hypothetical protein